MADIKPLLRREPDDNFLSEDDPLAELARIVGFEPKVEPRASAAMQRREPEFDLEDELLKEFEQYSAPEPVAFTPVIEAPVVIAETPEPAIDTVATTAGRADERTEPPLLSINAPDPVYPEEGEPEAHETDALAAVDFEAAQANEGPSADLPAEPVMAAPSVFDLEDRILREFSAFDARRMPMASQALMPLRAEIERHEPVFEPEWQDKPAPVDEPVTEPVAEPVHAFTADDLSDLAVDEAFVPAIDEPDDAPVLAQEDPYWAELDAEVLARAAQMQPAPDAGQDGIEPLSLDAVAPAFAEDDDIGSARSPEVDAFEDEPFEVSPQEAESIPAEPVQSEPALIAPAVVAAVVAPAAVYTDYGLDDLLAEVEKYPVAESSGRWGVQAKPADQAEVIAPPAQVTLPVEALADADVDRFIGDGVSAAESEAQWAELAYDADPEEQSPAVHDVPPVEIEPAPNSAAVRDWPEDDVPAFELTPPDDDVVAATAVSQTNAPAATYDDDVDFGNFELDFDDIELDLSELSEPEMASAAAMAELADAEVETPALQPAYIPAIVPVATRGEDYASLPFDPTQIVPETEALEALGEMDVPETPVVPDETTQLGSADYDIDLDAEMADLFAGPVETAPVRDLAATPASAVPAPYNALELDEFERALEEDFRQSLKENRLSTDPDRVSLTPQAPPPVRSGGNRWMLVSAAAAVVFVAGGAGVYALMYGQTNITTRPTEPKIILADKDPVRVVPDDKGGRTVPNQDKAVYDRVAGVQSDVTKQESLVTSSEQPVDVVQKTLMPENLPMDDDSLAGTLTEDTTDPRLLPKEEQDRISTANKVVSGVSPRKVKTMVVKADGTLVAREEAIADDQQQATNDAELMKIAQKAAADAEKAATPVEDDVARAIESVPDRLTPTETTDTTAAAANETAPAETVAETSAAKSVTLPPATEAEPASTDAASQPEAVAESAETPVVAPVEAAALPEATPSTAVTDEPAAVTEPPVDVVAAEPVPVETPVTAPVTETPVEKPATETVAEVPADTPVTTPAETTAVENTSIAAAADAEVEETAPVRKVKTSTFTPIPEIRPIDQPVNVVGRVTERGTVNTNEPAQVAAADPATQPVATTTPSGGYVIQIASLPSQAEAESSYQKLSSKFGSVIGGRGVDIRKAQIKNKGTYYRVRVPAGSKAEAQALCAQYKSAGGSCLVSK